MTENEDKNIEAVQTGADSAEGLGMDKDDGPSDPEVLDEKTCQSSMDFKPEIQDSVHDPEGQEWVTNGTSETTDGPSDELLERLEQLRQDGEGPVSLVETAMTLKGDLGREEAVRLVRDVVGRIPVDLIRSDADGAAEVRPYVYPDDLNLNPDAVPPFDRFAALLESNTKFKQTWLRKRPDLESQADYDRALAQFAAAANWRRQEIADLVIAFRRKYGEDVQNLDQGYMQRVVSSSLGRRERTRTVRRLAENVGTFDPDSYETAEERERARKEILSELSAALVLEPKAVRWEQHGRENARYWLWLEDGRRIQIGGVSEVLSPSRFRAALYGAGILVRQFKSDDWHQLCQILLSVVVVVENVEATTAFQTDAWVEAYLQSHPPASEDKWPEAAFAKSPFIRDGKIWLTAQELRKHMRLVQNEINISHAELCDDLRAAGFERQTVHGRISSADEQFSRSYWCRVRKDQPGTYMEK